MVRTAKLCDYAATLPVLGGGAAEDRLPNCIVARKGTVMGVFGYGADAKPKVKVEVEVVAEGDVMTGSIFLNPSERIIDMMND